MNDIAAMLLAYPGPTPVVDQDAFVRCVEECQNLVSTCTACADACLAESDRADLVRCAAAALDCADIAGATLRVVSRHAGYDATVVQALLGTCIEACRWCYDQCRKHALEHEHCRICADACHRCGHACRELLTAMT
jgi:hypothetical protein